jgi:hypothetical protein
MFVCVYVCMCVCTYDRMHSHTVGDIDLKPSQVGKGRSISGLRGGDDQGGDPPTAPGVPNRVFQGS